MWRQSMQMKWIAPSTDTRTNCAKASPRKPVKDARSISPQAMANSRWRMAPEPQTWPSIGTL